MGIHYGINDCKYRLRFGYKFTEIIAMSQQEIKEKLGVQFANLSKSKFRKVIKYEVKRFPYSVENAKKIKTIRDKCKIVLSNAKGRCKYSSSHNNYYIKKGIQCFLTLEDVIFLWWRDNANSMKQPSLDRINGDDNYALHNCRFIEWVENRKRNSLTS